MNSTVEAVDGEADQRKATVGSQVYSIGVFFGVLIILMAATYLYYYIYKRIKAIDSSHTNPSSNRGWRWRRSSIISRATTTTITSSDYDSDSGDITYGLDEATIHALPTLLYFKVKSHKGGDCGGSSGCSICLQDYTDTDNIRLLPECGHFFHLKCVDPWLRIHPNCPICRNPQVPLPVANLPAAEAAVISTQ